MARDEKERLLSAHAAAEGVQATPVDMEPGQRVLRDLRHARQIADLARIAPRVERQRASLSFRIDHREAADGGEPTPAADVLLRADAAAVRRDHERDRGVVGSLASPGPGAVSNATRADVNAASFTVHRR